MKSSSHSANSPLAATCGRAVVFLILTIVQFLVIAKGAERVAEVGARFTLDAMPGKQMSIDADMRAGVIDMEEARNGATPSARKARCSGPWTGP